MLYLSIYISIYFAKCEPPKINANLAAGLMEVIDRNERERASERARECVCERETEKKERAREREEERELERERERGRERERERERNCGTLDVPNINNNTVSLGWEFPWILQSPAQLSLIPSLFPKKQ